MTRLIDADALKEHFKEYTTHSGIQASLDRYALKVIEEEPTVDAVPVVHAQWLNSEDTGEKMYECSYCECRMIARWYDMAVGLYGFKYCPYCGARMDEK